jgi:hypothetical protein
MGRAVAESIWLPTSLLPRYGVDWTAEGDEHLVADIPIRDARVSLEDFPVYWAVGNDPMLNG